MQWVSSKFSKQMTEIHSALLKTNEGKGNNFSFKRLASTSSLAAKRLKTEAIERKGSDGHDDHFVVPTTYDSSEFTRLSAS
jgi:hypothetical protein